MLGIDLYKNCICPKCGKCSELCSCTNGKTLSDILPWSEPERNDNIEQVIKRKIKPLSEENKQKDMEILSKK